MVWDHVTGVLNEKRHCELSIWKARQTDLLGRFSTFIEADPGAPRHIQTVWGAGYKFAL